MAEARKNALRPSLLRLNSNSREQRTLYWKNLLCVNIFIKTVLLIIFCFCSATSFAQKQLAFPTEEGYGKYSVGGRGGNVYEVTTLNSSGAGSLGEAVEDSDANLNFSTFNMIANYYKPGPATRSNVKRRIAEPGGNDGGVGSWYVADNHVDGFPNVTANNWLSIDGSSYNKMSAPWDAMPINQESPQDAYNAVLAHAGCSKPNRDSADARIMNEVAAGTATYGVNGIITSPSDMGGWPTLAGGTPPVDTDHDGMPDEWESMNELDPNNAADRNNVGADGYTMLEKYLNSIG